MERRHVYPVKRAPDAALVYLAEQLEGVGFSVDTGAVYDVSARRGGDRVLVGIAPHPRGLVARVNCKAALPGRGRDLHELVEGLLSERLGDPDAEASPRA